MKNKTHRDSESVIIKDALGLEWRIKEARPTKYGFDIYYGKRKDPSPYEIGGPNRLIYTNDLKTFWEKHSLRHDGTIFDLPAGRTTLKRARMALGFNWDNDSHEFWRKHKLELSSLRPRAFAEKCEQQHKDQRITRNRVNAWRVRLVGYKARPVGWWRKPEVLQILLSEKMPLKQMKAQLGGNISTSQLFRLRRQAKTSYQICMGELIQIAASDVASPASVPQEESR